MKAVGLYKHLPIEDSQSLVDLDIQDPGHPTGFCMCEVTVEMSDRFLRIASLGFIFSFAQQ